MDRKEKVARNQKKGSGAAFLIYASNEPKSVLARDLGDCRDNLRNSRSVFLIVLSIINKSKSILNITR